MKFFTTLEGTVGEKHKEFLKSDAFKTVTEGTAEFGAKMAEAEAPGMKIVSFYFFFLFFSFFFAVLSVCDDDNLITL